MGNSMIACGGNGERLITAARDGDLAEARKLLEGNRGLAKCSTFGLLNSPLHLASARGYHEVVALLLENGADVNSRNIYGQTPLTQACRYGHWEVVQNLLVYKSNVLKVECLGSKTALHFAAANGHIRCIRLLAADFGPTGISISNSKTGDDTETEQKSELVKYINKPANNGVTALHMAAMNGHFECVHLLLDLYASATSQTLLYASSSMGSIGAGSTALHFAAAGGNVKCCQVLIDRGANRSAINCNGWLPIDIARIWGRHWLEQLLSPKSNLIIPTFPPSCFLSLPLSSILHIARDYGLRTSESWEEIDESDCCAVCLERACNVAAQGCDHELCMKCAMNLCSTMKSNESSQTLGTIPCPLCRFPIKSFKNSPFYEPIKQNSDLSVAVKNDKSQVMCKSEFYRNSSTVVPSETISPLISASSNSAILS
ncbi:hypothetical protein LUZ60_007185 [Juncus effusus]|nr:hypothetical protein LUZ60_007185 [Juncus effusus]